MGIWVVNEAEKMVLTFDPEVHEEAQVQLSPQLIEIQLFAGSWALVRGDFMERCEPRRPTPGSIPGP